MGVIDQVAILEVGEGEGVAVIDIDPGNLETRLGGSRENHDGDGQK